MKEKKEIAVTLSYSMWALLSPAFICSKSTTEVESPLGPKQNMLSHSINYNRQDSGGGTLVEHSNHHPKVKDSSLAIAAKMAKRHKKLFQVSML
jgi:hypothetical protein